VLVDSHCHLNYLDDCDAKLEVARSRGVRAFLCIGVGAETEDGVAAIAGRHPDVYTTHGVHPDHVVPDFDFTWLETALARDRVIGVGETGLDYFRLPSSDDGARALQRDAFALHLEHGASRGLPVVVHSRAAEADTHRLLDGHRGATGVLHCFTESWDLAKKALDLGWYVSISGIVTFKNGDDVRAVARRIPADRLLIETDCPWLAPVPHRGKRNEPAYVADTAAFLAALRGVDVETLARQTTENFARLFARAQLNLD